MKVKSESEVAQSCLTRRDPMDCSLPGSSVHGFSRQEYWSGVPLPSPHGLLGIQKMSIQMSTGGRGQGNYMERALGFPQILHHQTLDPKGGTMEFQV